MSLRTDASPDVAAAVTIVMRENACDAHAAARLIRERGRALGLSIDEVATTIVQITQLCAAAAGHTPAPTAYACT